MASLTSPPLWPLTLCRRSWPSAPGQAAYECILEQSSGQLLTSSLWRHTTELHGCEYCWTLKKQPHNTDLKQSTIIYIYIYKSDQFLQVHKPVALLRRVSGAETFTSFSHYTPQHPHFIPPAALSLHVAWFSCRGLRTVYPTADPPWVHPVTAEGRRRECNQGRRLHPHK